MQNGYNSASAAALFCYKFYDFLKSNNTFYYERTDIELVVRTIFFLASALRFIARICVCVRVKEQFAHLLLHSDDFFVLRFVT